MATYRKGVNTLSGSNHRSLKSSVDPYVPLILQPWVRIQSKTITLFQVKMMLHLQVDCGKNENKQKKWPRLAHIKK